jgi:hypothetical protein
MKTKTTKSHSAFVTFAIFVTFVVKDQVMHGWHRLRRAQALDHCHAGFESRRTESG